MKTLNQITVSVILLSLIWGVSQLAHMPAEMPIHFGANGIADRYASKYIEVILLPLISTLLFAFFKIVSRSEARRTGNQGHEKDMDKISFGLIIFLAAIHVGSINSGINGTNFNPRYVAMGLSGFIIYLGFILPSMNFSKLMNIQIPRYLNTPENWDKISRFSGALYVVFGTVALIGSYFFPENIVPVSAIFLTIAVTSVYSWMLNRHNHAA